MNGINQETKADRHGLLDDEPSLPPISGGSGLAELIDAWEPTLTAEDRGYRAAFSDVPRAYAPYGPDRDGWLAGYEQLERERGVKRGPTDEDIAYEQGRSAFLGSKTVVQPPATLSTFERLAFLAGVSDAARDYHTKGLEEHETRRQLETCSVWAD